MKLIDKLWNWGHLEGSHNKSLKFNCNMSPEQFAEEYGIKNAFIVSYGGNIQPPYDALAKRMSSLKNIKWSVLGDASTPLPDARLGNTEDVISTAKQVDNISGGVVDDFFSPIRLERFTPEVLSEIKKTLNDNGLDFWCVLYAHELDKDINLAQYLPCFDGITFWLWNCSDIPNIEDYTKRIKALAGDIPVMMGAYLWDYSINKPMDSTLFKKQLEFSFDLIIKGELEGAVICSNTIGDADIETNRILKEYLKKYGDVEVKS
jgi:hypothetical protein